MTTARKPLRPHIRKLADRHWMCLLPCAPGYPGSQAYGTFRGYGGTPAQAYKQWADRNTAWLALRT